MRNKILPYILVVILVFFTDDSLLFGTNSNPAFIITKYVVYVILIFSGLLSFNKVVKKKSFIKSIGAFAVLGCLVLVSSLYNDDFKTGNLLALLTLLTGIIYVQFIDFMQFRIVYIKVIYFLAICSLLIYITNIILPSIISVFPTITNYGNVEFKTLLISNVFNGTNQFRNTGIFREPGVYSIYLLFAVIFMLFGNEKVSIKKLSVLVLTIFTTLSTAGIFVLFIITICYFIVQRNLKNVFISLGLASLLYILFAFFPAIFEGLFAKLNSGDKDYMSSMSRLSSFLTPLEIIKSSPVFGVGLTQFVYLYELYSYKVVGFSMKADSTSTNTFLNSIAIFGVLYGVLILRYFYTFSKILIGSFAVIMLLILFIMFSSQELRYSLLFNTLMAYGIYYRNITVSNT